MPSYCTSTVALSDMSPVKLVTMEWKVDPHLNLPHERGRLHLELIAYHSSATRGRSSTSHLGASPRHTRVPDPPGGGRETFTFRNLYLPPNRRAASGRCARVQSLATPSGNPSPRVLRQRLRVGRESHYEAPGAVITPAVIISFPRKTTRMATGSRDGLRAARSVASDNLEGMPISLPLVQTNLDPRGTMVAERLACSPPTKANRVQSPAGQPDFRMWESCWTMTLVGGFFLWDLPFSFRPFIPAPLHTHLDHPHRLSRPRRYTKETTQRIRVQQMVIEVSMEQRENERAGETGDPRENPPTNDIVRHYSHLRKSVRWKWSNDGMRELGERGSLLGNPLFNGNSPLRYPLVKIWGYPPTRIESGITEREGKSIMANVDEECQSRRLPFDVIQDCGCESLIPVSTTYVVVCPIYNYLLVRLLTSHLGETGFDSMRCRSQIFACGNRAGRRRYSAGFLGDLPFPALPAFWRCSVPTSLHPHRAAPSAVDRLHDRSPRPPNSLRDAQFLEPAHPSVRPRALPTSADAGPVNQQSPAPARQDRVVTLPPESPINLPRRERKMSRVIATDARERAIALVPRQAPTYVA
ncbi:hypothetical protein PR048_026184 [Dryococelus australis]|uniref:Uncharacterized protein n=1 Tax=Dryococelus australis TaxID=614101 RepID=A0ABQ9GKN1_9NEOP|nr:hypothetical protein PR048_026184 [Dryococelus australis]